MPCQSQSELWGQLFPGAGGGEAEGERAPMKLNDYPCFGNNSPAGGGSTSGAPGRLQLGSSRNEEPQVCCVHSYESSAERVLFCRSRTYCMPRTPHRHTGSQKP